MTRRALLLQAWLCGCAGSDATDDPDPGSVTSLTSTSPTSPTTPTDTPSTPDTGTTESTPTGTTPPSFTDFHAVGPHAVTQHRATLEVPDCSLGYTEFRPDGDSGAPLVVLGHGFQRDRGNVANLAAHVASHGMRVATPDYCHAWVLDSDPAQNGVDAALLAQVLAPAGPTFHAGHSNGGLSALFAAAADPNVVAVMGLDPVDTEGIVQGALDGITVPIWALFGEPTGCNEDGGLLGPLRGAGGAVNGLAGANHCDFEGPTNGLCTALCGQPSGNAPVVQTLLAAFAAYSLGLDPTGAEWVLPGGLRYQELIDQGVLVAL